MKTKVYLILAFIIFSFHIAFSQEGDFSLKILNYEWQYDVSDKAPIKVFIKVTNKGSSSAVWEDYRNITIDCMQSYMKERIAVYEISENLKIEVLPTKYTDGYILLKIPKTAEGLKLMLNGETSKTEFENYASFQSQYDRAIQLFKEKQYSRCLEHLETYMKYVKGHEDAYFTAGQAYFKTKNYQKAIDSYSEAINMNSRYAKAFNGRGVCYFLYKKHTEATEDLKTAISLEPDFYEAFVNLASVYFESFKYNEAIQTWEEAIKIKPDKEQELRSWINRAKTNSKN